MDIFTKVGKRGDGEHLMTYGEKIKKDGTKYDEILITTAVNFLATDNKDKYLIAIGDMDTSKVDYRVISNKELKGKADFSAMIRPYSMLASSTDFELLLNYWRVNTKPNNLVYLKDLVGRYTDDHVDFWILDKEIVFKELKGGVVLKAKEGVVAELKQNQFDLMVMPYEGTIDFKIGDNWYWIENEGVGQELRPMAIPNEVPRVETKEYLRMWGEQYGNQIQNMAMLGWFISCMYMEEVTKGRGLRFFPYLALSGLTQTGKTSLISNYLRFWGLEAKPVDYTQVSPFVEIKQLTQVSCMPVWRDEFREGVGYSKAKETILRSLYNMSTLSKGTANQQLINYNVKTSLLLSGEDAVNDPATRRRCIYFGLSDEWKLSADQFTTSSMMAEEYFSHLFYIILKEGFDIKKFREAYLYAKLNLVTVNDRAEEGVCYASLGAVFGVEFAKNIINSASNYWKLETINRPGLVQRTDLFGQFWEAASIYFDQYNYWDTTEIYGEMKKPKILDLIWYKEATGTLYFNIKPLIRYVYQQGGLANNTTINAQACESLLCAKLKSKLGRQSIDGKQISGIEVSHSDVAKGSALDTIILNVYSTYAVYAQWRREKFNAIEGETIKELTMPI